MNEESEAASEGREFLKLVTDVDPEVIDNEDKYDDAAIEVWLEELGCEWNGWA